MCGRYALYTPRSAIAEKYFGIERAVGDQVARYNVAPGTQITLIRAAAQPSDERPVEFDFSWWGFRPAWADDKAPRPINAKAGPLIQ